MADKEKRNNAVLAGDLLLLAFQILKERGGELPARELFARIEERVEFSIHEKEISAQVW